MILQESETAKIFSPQMIESVVDSVYYHWRAWVPKSFLRQRARELVGLVGEDMSGLDRVVRDYLESVARAEKARLSGYHIDDEAFYTPGVVAALLPVALELEDALAPTFDPSRERSGSGGGGHYGDLATSLLDVREAWANTAFRGVEMQILTARYVEDMEWGHIAASYQITVEEAKLAAVRGLRRMLNHLGGKNPHRKDWNA